MTPPEVPLRCCAAVERVDPGTGLVKWRLEYRLMASPAGGALLGKGRSYARAGAGSTAAGRCSLHARVGRLQAGCSARVLCRGCAPNATPAARMLNASLPGPPTCPRCSPAAGAWRRPAGGAGCVRAVWQDGALAARLLLRRPRRCAESHPGEAPFLLHSLHLDCCWDPPSKQCAVHSAAAALVWRLRLPLLRARPPPLPPAVDCRAAQAGPHPGSGRQCSAGWRAAAGGGGGGGAGAGGHGGGCAAGRVGGSESAGPGCRQARSVGMWCGRMCVRA